MAGQGGLGVMKFIRLQESNMTELNLKYTEKKCNRTSESEASRMLESY